MLEKVGKGVVAIVLGGHTHTRTGVEDRPNPQGFGTQNTDGVSGDGDVVSVADENERKGDDVDDAKVAAAVVRVLVDLIFCVCLSPSLFPNSS